MGSRPCAGVTLALRFPVNSVQVRREERKLQITRLRMLLMVEALADAKRHTDSGAWSLKDQTARAPQRAITRATALPGMDWSAATALAKKGGGDRDGYDVSNWGDNDMREPKQGSKVKVRST
jgi:hypothetical protein